MTSIPSNDFGETRSKSRSSEPLGSSHALGQIGSGEPAPREQSKGTRQRPTRRRNYQCSRPAQSQPARSVFAPITPSGVIQARLRSSYGSYRKQRGSHRETPETCIRLFPQPHAGARCNSRLRESRGNDRHDLAGNIVLRAITIYADPVGTLGLVEIAVAYPLKQDEVSLVTVPTRRLALRR